MQLPKNVYTHLVKEFQYIAERMPKENHPSRKLYLFSALYGEANRALNLSWDRDLLLIHNVTKSMYQEVNIRLQSALMGQEIAIGVPPKLMELLESATRDLAEFVEKNGPREDLCEILGRIAEIGYVTTGNGFYLFQKGDIKL